MVRTDECGVPAILGVDDLLQVVEHLCTAGMCVVVVNTVVHLMLWGSRDTRWVQTDEHMRHV